MRRFRRRRRAAPPPPLPEPPAPRLPASLELVQGDMPPRYYATVAQAAGATAARPQDIERALAGEGPVGGIAARWRDLPVTFDDISSRHSHAQTLLESGDPRGAERELTACLKWLAAMYGGRMEMAVAAVRSTLGRAYTDLGEFDMARATFEDVIAEFAGRPGEERNLRVALTWMAVLQRQQRELEQIQLQPAASNAPLSDPRAELGRLRVLLIGARREHDAEREVACLAAVAGVLRALAAESFEAGDIAAARTHAAAAKGHEATCRAMGGCAQRPGGGAVDEQDWGAPLQLAEPAASRSRLGDYVPLRQLDLSAVADGLQEALDPEQRFALQRYTGEDYQAINGYLRRLRAEGRAVPAGGAVSPVVRTIQLIDGAFRAARPLSYPIKVFRGVAFDAAEKLRIMDAQQVGECNDNVTAGQYLSCSTEAFVSEQFVRHAKERRYRWAEAGLCCFVEISIPAGYRVIPMEWITLVEGESEVLLPRDAQLRFLGRGTRMMRAVWPAEAVAPAPLQGAGVQWAAAVGSPPHRGVVVRDTKVRVYRYEVCFG